MFGGVKKKKRKGRGMSRVFCLKTVVKEKTCGMRGEIGKPLSTEVSLIRKNKKTEKKLWGKCSWPR